MRYCQQDALYAAEAHASQHRGDRFSSVDDAQAWIDGLVATDWWQWWYAPVAFVEVTAQDRRRRHSVGAWFPDRGGAVIAMLPCHLTQRDLLHETAHPVAEALYGSRSHDPAFARTFLELVYLAMGAQAWRALHQAFTGHDIDQDWHTYRGIAMPPATEGSR